ncbi:bromodomain-containing protein DDB_G0270170 isoform X2 [Orussus abietinus]|uniref:bromodomain-containing protein DDB_G0270170 isoform X2 n=1 Tax=Orussus abietinus TaxID=222816 RepID=UPI000626727B|nr:bromodomain-containing protein DDB_G0270170 isoform X2 [Orussus abietinus]
MDNKRSHVLKSGSSNPNSSNHLRKNKKRSNRKNSTGSWGNDRQVEQDGGQVSGMEYAHMFWQQPEVQQQLVASNGQRLFATMSDPSVCGYSAMPMTYTMEPVSLPPVYQLLQPIPRPSYRPLRGRLRRNFVQSHRMGSHIGGHPLTNGYSSLQENELNCSVSGGYQNGDYASLPPTANNDNANGREELSSEHRRYSDPGLGPAEPSNNSQSDDSASVESGSSITTIGRSSKLVLSLVEQMTVLKESNSQLFKELHETKSDLENVKSELAQFKHSNSTDYQPGMLTDIVREMRDANKLREEILISKVTSTIEEKQIPKSTEIEELRSRLNKMAEEKVECDKRIARLEEEVTGLKLHANNEGREIAAFEEEVLALRRELQEAMASRTLAEHHASKCVNAVARPVTPVTFDTPCTTSTPVRTTTTSTSPPTSSTSSFSSSRSTAASRVPEKVQPSRKVAKTSGPPRRIVTNLAKSASSCNQRARNGTSLSSSPKFMEDGSSSSSGRHFSSPTNTTAACETPRDDDKSTAEKKSKRSVLNVKRIDKDNNSRISENINGAGHNVSETPIRQDRTKAEKITENNRLVIANGGINKHDKLQESLNWRTSDLLRNSKNIGDERHSSTEGFNENINVETEIQATTLHTSRTNRVKQEIERTIRKTNDPIVDTTDKNSNLENVESISCSTDNVPGSVQSLQSSRDSLENLRRCNFVTADLETLAPILGPPNPQSPRTLPVRA